MLMNKKACLPTRRGFTWLEVIIIIAIVVVIFVLARIGINNAQVNSRDIERIAGIKQIQNSLEFYFYHRSQYPILENVALGNSDFKLLCDTDLGFQVNDENCEKIFLKEILPAPTSPLENSYLYSSNGQDYTITFTLEKGIGGLGVGEHKAHSEGIQ